MIVWITGPSGVGKTTLARKFLSVMKTTQSNTVYLDGDALRYINSDDLKHSLNDRYKNAQRMQNYCNYLDKQGFNVIASIMLLFEDICLENYQLYSNFYHFNLQVPENYLKNRDSKQVQGKLDHELLKMAQLNLDSKKIELDGRKDIFSNIRKIMETTSLKIEYVYDKQPINSNQWWHSYSNYDYLGPKFLESYFESRNKIISVDASKYQNFDVEKIMLNKLHENYTSTSISPQIESFLISIFEHKVQDIDKIELIQKLINTFEVSKKLYQFYSLSIKKINDIPPQSYNYVVLSYLVSKYMTSKLLDKTQQIIFLNALIKLNDLIIGKFYNNLDGAWKDILEKSLIIEIKFVNWLKN